jgi:hypothetical protein
VGYTHYWYRDKKTLEGFDRFAEDCRKIIESVGEDIPLAYEYDRAKKAPAINTKVVRFNGIGEEGHETFYVPKTWTANYEGQSKGEDGWFAFCKTARKPYDKIVVACLIAMRHNCPGVKISSDGEDADWNAGRQLCQTVLGYGDEYHLGERWLEKV